MSTVSSNCTKSMGKVPKTPFEKFIKSVRSVRKLGKLETEIEELDPQSYSNNKLGFVNLYGKNLEECVEEIDNNQPIKREILLICMTVVKDSDIVDALLKKYFPDEHILTICSYEHFISTEIMCKLAGPEICDYVSPKLSKHYRNYFKTNLPNVPPCYELDGDELVGLFG